jgi:glutamyl-Q tRNA(Asp) synthetase
VTAPRYVGRFAPSPTGPLHLGSLFAAVGSWLDARAAGGRWLLRIEDLDPPREVPGAADEIVRSLEVHGLTWDGPVLHQSTRLDAYGEALAQLERDGRLFRCRCTRRRVRALGGVYDGRCRSRGMAPTDAPHAVRLRVPEETIGFRDRLQGPFAQDLAREVGDFVLVRRDGLVAYQLAVVVDDGAQGVTDVVRGADLLDSTPRQLLLQRLLGLPEPRYLHLPLLLGPDGAKLSKQTGAPGLDPRRARENLARVLAWLGLEGAPGEPPEAQLAAATRAWEPARLPPRARTVLDREHR